jgi:SAM-dependent methyltransferase
MKEKDKLQDLFVDKIQVEGNIISTDLNADLPQNQLQTEKIFSDKWTQAEQYGDIEKAYEFQRNWFLKLYGFETEENLKNYLADKKVIIDTGCGLGYKAAWFAELAPQAIVLGIDISDSLELAAKNFHHLSNLFFLKSDIAKTGMKPGSVECTVCDQVIMHTEVPEQTFAHLSDITSPGHEFLCYVYSKKALPRELIDDYFRKATSKISNDKMWELSDQLTQLGKNLSELKVEFECPDIPLLGIKGGVYDIQRFLYWNFLKCFWNEELGYELSKSTNYDWYAPSNAKRFSKEEFLKIVSDNHLTINFFREEEACYTGRFLKN